MDNQALAILVAVTLFGAMVVGVMATHEVTAETGMRTQISASTPFSPALKPSSQKNIAKESRDSYQIH